MQIIKPQIRTLPNGIDLTYSVGAFAAELPMSQKLPQTKSQTKRKF
jgi:hypothetical protein